MKKHCCNCKWREHDGCLDCWECTNRGKDGPTMSKWAAREEKEEVEG